MRTALVNSVRSLALLEQCLYTRQHMCPQRCEGERASNMAPSNGHDGYATGRVAGSVVVIQHIPVVLRQ
jgi:hypothetical protein